MRLELEVDGAPAEATPEGARLVLSDGGRKIAYHHVQAVDATGKALLARIEVLSANRLAVVLDDTGAVYPVRIDPTFSDANWISLAGLPGANFTVNAAVVDGAGNLYIGGNFTAVGTAAANYIAKWDGSTWSALGSGMNNQVFAMAMSGTTLYAGGAFGVAGGAPAYYIAKWNGSSWSPVGSRVNTYVYSLAVSGSDLYAGGFFSMAGGVSAYGIAKWDGSS